MAEAYIVAAARTAGGRKGGRLAGWHPADLAASVLDALVERSGAAPDQIEDVIMGCVMQVGEQSNNIARNAIMASKLPESVPGTSIDRQCGSSQQALHFAAQAVMSGTMDVVIAAGVEAMTRVPMGLASSLPAKNGFGHYKSPNIEQRYPNIVFSQFTGAEMMAEKYGLSKDELDEYAYGSHQRAIAATQAGRFKDEIAPVTVQSRKGDIVVDQDEYVRPGTTLDAVAKLKPAFSKDGTVTAGNASGLNDGAAAFVIMSATEAQRRGITPLARIASWSTAGVNPAIMGSGPIPASRRALEKAGWKVADLDLIEANEAFAAQAIAVNKDMGWNTGIVNVNGGAIAIGHPIGASGARILVTLLYEMQKRDAKRGLATLCIGGGMGIALAVER